MDLAPIPTLPAVSPSTPAARAEFATTRPIDFRPQDSNPDQSSSRNNQQDATYTPSHSTPDHENPPASQARTISPEGPIDEPPSESTISLFA